MQHINFGMVAVTSVHLEDMMNEDRNTMHDQIKTNIDNCNEIPDPVKTADEVGISGNKIQDMVGKRVTVMSTNGIEYFPSRETQDHTYNIMFGRKGSITSLYITESRKLPSEIDTNLSSIEIKARELIILSSLCPDVVKVPFSKLELSLIVSYYWKLTHAETLIVKSQDQQTALARLWLYRSCGDILANAMKLLTLDPLDRLILLIQIIAINQD
ncbi:hypothetical protein MJO29_010699 [Puccinia striiformis f. sp. tritici]|nr:hypothetical protein MJO29_010699 [Puccinia striiformis f. sp. tritici]